MKILHIITGLNNGGAEATLFRLTTNDANNEHIVISMMDLGTYGPRLIEKGVRVETLNLKRGSLNPIAFYKLYKLVKSVNASVVQTWMYHADLVGGLAAKLAGSPAIVWGIRNSTLSAEKTSLMSRLVVKICAHLSKYIPHRIVSCSIDAVNVHEKLGYRSSKFYVIPNGFDLTKLSPNIDSQIIKKQWSPHQDGILIGTVARWDPQKDHKNFLHAFKMLKHTNLKCVFVGTDMDSNNKELSALINNLDLQDFVHLLGPQNDIPSVMNCLNLHVLPSAYGEAFPNVLAEAMACEVPCIATSVGDAALIVGNTGWIVPPQDSESLAAAINCALEEMKDSTKWAEKKQACRDRIVGNFSIEKMIKSYNQIWHEVSNRSS